MDRAAADLASYQASVKQSREAVSERGLDEAVPGEDYTLRWIYPHMIEEYARHNGHADLLRNASTATLGRASSSSAAVVTSRWRIAQQGHALRHRGYFDLIASLRRGRVTSSNWCAVVEDPVEDAFRAGKRLGVLGILIRVRTGGKQLP